MTLTSVVKFAIGVILLPLGAAAHLFPGEQRPQRRPEWPRRLAQWAIISVAWCAAVAFAVFSVRAGQYKWAVASMILLFGSVMPPAVDLYLDVE